MSQLIQQVIEDIVVVVAALIALGLGWFSIHYLTKRQQMLDQRQMAALVKGLHYAGVAQGILIKPAANSSSKPAADSRDHVLRGLLWLLGAAGLSAALYGYSLLQPLADPTTASHAAVGGILPAGIGLAHLIFSAILRNRQKPSLPTRPLCR
jgi:hypothetical protein